MTKRSNLNYLLFVNLFSLVGYYTFAPLYALFANSFVSDAQTISLVWGGYSLLQAFLILFFGRFENDKKKGKMLVLGYALCAFAALSFLVVDSLTSLVFVLAFNAFAASMVAPAFKTLFAKNESSGRESEQWSWLDSGTMFAAAGGGILGGIVVGMYGFQGIFIAMATIQIIAAAVAYRSLYKVL